MHAPSFGGVALRNSVMLRSKPTILLAFIAVLIGLGFSGATNNVHAQQGGGDVPLVINEFMAANHRAVADPQGHFDDWIELLPEGAE